MRDNKARIAEAIAFAESRLFDDLRPADLAASAGLSEYHFLRSFQAMAGVTAGEYLRNRRMEEAARLLEGTDRRILDIAVDCGFSSQEAFSRAFFRCFGLPPGAFRLLKPPRKHFRRIAALGGDRGGFPPSPPRLEDLEASALFGIGAAVPMDGYAAARAILSLWKRFFALFPDAARAAPYFAGLGSYLGAGAPDSSRTDAFEYFAGVPAEGAGTGGEGGSFRPVPAGTYAAFEYDGPARRTRDAFDHIFGEWLPSSPYVLRPGSRGEIGFELYRPSLVRGTVDRTMTIYVPIEIQSSSSIEPAASSPAS